MRRAEKPLPVIVAGGGIGGLAAAIALRQARCAVIVLERSPRFGEIGAGIQLAPNAFNALQSLDVAEAALGQAVYIERLVLMDAVTGVEVAAVPVGEAFRRWFKNPYAVIHRADLHQALMNRCTADSGVQLLASQQVAGFTQQAGHVEVRTIAGAVYKGAALVGADGIRSRVREILLDDGGPKISGHVCYRAVLPIEQMPQSLRQNAAVLWAGPKSHFVHYPLRGGRQFNIVATFHSADDTSEQHNAPGSAAELMAHFQHLPEAARSILERASGWRRWVLGDRDPVPNWTRGSITLLGDAAHPTHQYFAQGACMAMEDAVCLRAEIERAGGDLPAGFQRYQERRITRTARIVLASRAIGQYFYHAAGVERLVRNQILAEKSPEDFYRSLDWIYGYGRDGSADGAPGSATRMPDKGAAR